MPEVLLDSNVLIAILLDGHTHHEAASQWFADNDGRFATCPMTEGSLIREVIRGGDGVDVALSLLRQISDHDEHEFWADECSYLDVRMTGILGRQQVTDAYLAQLTRRRRGRIATFDRGFAALHSDVAALVPTG